MALGELDLRDALPILRREALMGALLGSVLGVFGFLTAYTLFEPSFTRSLAIGLTLVAVVTCGTLAGCALPLLFRRVGWDPAMASSPFVACFVDVVGVLVYMAIVGAIVGGSV